MWFLNSFNQDIIIKVMYLVQNFNNIFMSPFEFRNPNYAKAGVAHRTANSQLMMCGYWCGVSPGP